MRATYHVATLSGRRIDWIFLRRHLPAPWSNDAVGHTYGPYRPAFERQQSTGNIFVVVAPLRCSRLSLYGHDFSGQIPQKIDVVDQID